MIADASLPQQQPAPLPKIGELRFGDLWVSLRLGVADFRRAPVFGLFFSAVYVLGGFLMISLGAGHVTWTLATSLGFPLAAPFAAVGLYEVSRRLETGLPLRWAAVLGVVWAERSRQIPMMGALIVVFFLFWTFLAHMIFALFMGLSAMTNISQDLGVLWTGAGLRMIGAEMLIGAALAFLLFSLTVVSLPLLLEREIDFVTAMILSLRCTVRNIAVLAVWALIDHTHP